jgi:hypothetical protein
MTRSIAALWPAQGNSPPTLRKNLKVAIPRSGISRKPFHSRSRGAPCATRSWGWPAAASCRPRRSALLRLEGIPADAMSLEAASFLGKGPLADGPPGSPPEARREGPVSGTRQDRGRWKVPAGYQEVPARIKSGVATFSSPAAGAHRIVLKRIGHTAGWGSIGCPSSAVARSASGYGV